MSPFNTHIHLPPNFSAFESVAQAVSLAAAQGISVLGANNYYDFDVYTEFAARARENAIFPQFGLEIICLIDTLQASGIKLNDPGNPGKLYLCGKGMTGFHPLSEEAAALLQTIRDADSERMALVVAVLETLFADCAVPTYLTAKAIRQRIASRYGAPLKTIYLQERHVAQAFQEVLFEKMIAEARPYFLEALFDTPSKSNPADAAAVQNEIRSHLLKSGKPAYVPETFVGFDHAYRLLLALDSIPSYPVLADGASPLTTYEESPDALAADLRARGIPAAEFIPNRNAPGVLSHYVHTLRDAGLLITAGTEHNTPELIPLAPTCLGGEAIPEDVQKIFWEGTCIVAAHQHLTEKALPGFAPGSDLDEFRALGESVMEESRKKAK